MWQDVLPEIPRYLFVGKGYSFSGTDTIQSRSDWNHRNGWRLPQWALVGHYAVRNLWLDCFRLVLFAAIRRLPNYQFGDPAYQHINTFLFAYFVAKVVFFFTIFGSLHSDLPMFLGLLGLSISLNGGVAKPVVES